LCAPPQVQAAAANRARQTFLDGADHAGCSVAGHQQRVRQTAPAQLLEELPAARGILLGPRRQVQKRLFAVRQNAPGRQHGLARLAQMQPLGNAIDKQVGDREFRQITAGKRLVLRP